MNTPIRKLSVLILTMFVALMVASTSIQFFQAKALNADSRNARSLYREYSTYRGSIVVDGEAIVYSTPSAGPFAYQRVYTDGALYAPVTGYYSVVFQRTGLEQSANDLLNGNSDSLFWARLGDLLAGEQQRGASIELTLSGELQRVAAEALGSQRGSVVALDPRTGEILAMVTSPSYDPTLLAGHDTSVVNTNYQALLADSTDPLINRAISGDTYPPGSVFKLVTATAALEAGYTPSSVLLSPDELQLPQSTTTIGNYADESCDDGDTTTLAEAMRVSCNTAFADIGLTLGWAAIERSALAYGWDTALDIPLPVTRSQLPDSPTAAEGAMSAIGQFDVRATPLQAAMVAAGIANDGVLMKPYLISSVRAPDLSVIELARPSALSTPLSLTNAYAMQEMMVTVVDSGTGTRAQIPGVRVAGKTGTAQTGNDDDAHAWFVGFAPADNPVIAIAVLVENGGSAGPTATGGQVAAPIARAVMAAAIELEKARANS